MANCIRTIKDVFKQLINHNHFISDDLEIEDKKGEQMASQRARRLRKRRRAARTAGAEPDQPVAPEKLTRGRKLTLKKNANKVKALERRAHPELQYERVAFGDVAHAPPVLSAPRRAAPRAGAGAPRPGRRELLLGSMLPQAGVQRAPPAIELQRRERARLDVVAAYRQLKKHRQTEQSGNANKKPRSPS